MVTGSGYGRERQPTLLKVHHPPVPPNAQPPPLAWMSIARPAQLHDRPQVIKPRNPRPNNLPKRRVQSAPPRMRSRPQETREVLTTTSIPELDSAPPTSPADLSICSETPQIEILEESPKEPPPTVFVDTSFLSEPAPLTVEEEILEEVEEEPIDIVEEEGPEVEVVIEEVPEPEEQEPVADQETDEGYAGDTDITDKEVEVEEKVENEATMKRRLGRASFSKKKQSLLDGKDLLDEYMRMRHKMKKGSSSNSADGEQPMPTWMKSRLLPSKRSCRFELPIDVRLLEGMSPSEYLSNFCVVSERRQKWFNQAFTSADHQRKGHLGCKELKVALAKVHNAALNEEDMQLIIKVAGLEGKFEVGRKLFHGIAALSERILSNRIQVTAFSQSRRDLLEEADFEALEWKLRGVNVREELYCLFNHLST